MVGLLGDLRCRHADALLYQPCSSVRWCLVLWFDLKGMQRRSLLQSHVWSSEYASCIDHGGLLEPLSKLFPAACPAGLVRVGYVFEYFLCLKAHLDNVVEAGMFPPSGDPVQCDRAALPAPPQRHQSSSHWIHCNKAAVCLIISITQSPVD